MGPVCISLKALFMDGISGVLGRCVENNKTRQRQAGWLLKNICRQCDCCLWANISFLWWWSFLWEAKCAHPLNTFLCLTTLMILRFPPISPALKNSKMWITHRFPPKWENPPSSISSLAGDNQSAYQSTCRPVGLNFATTWSFSTHSCSCPLSTVLVVHKAFTKRFVFHSLKIIINVRNLFSHFFAFLTCCPGGVPW